MTWFYTVSSILEESVGTFCVNNGKLSPPIPQVQSWEYQYLQQLAKVSKHWLIGKGEGRNGSDSVFFLLWKKYREVWDQENNLPIIFSEGYFVFQGLFSKIVVYY